MIQIPASDLIQGHTFQTHRSEFAPRTLVVLIEDRLYAVLLDGPSSGYGEPLWDYIDPSELVFLCD